MLTAPALSEAFASSAQLLAEKGGGPNPYGIGAVIAGIAVLVILLIAMRRR